MAEIQRRIEDIGKVDLRKATIESAKPANGQAIPEGVKKVGDFGVLREDIVYIAPKPLISGRRKKIW